MKKKEILPLQIGIVLIMFGLIGISYLFFTDLEPIMDSIIYSILGMSFFLVICGVIIIFRYIISTEKDIEKEKLPPSTDDIKHAITQLNKNYELLRKQTTQGFFLAGIFMILGFLVILAGSLGELFGFTSKGSDLISLAGVIMEFISGTALFIYRQNFNRLNSVSDDLNKSWKFLIGFKKAENLPKTKIGKKIATRLIESFVKEESVKK